MRNTKKSLADLKSKMQLRQSGQKIVIASHNEGKVDEIRVLLSFTGLDVLSAKELSLPEPVEDGKTFIANAEIKAKTCAEKSGLLSLADDSGLVVPALGGAPGIYSARWAGPQKDFYAAMTLLENKLQPIDNRHAYFVCALSLAQPDGTCYTYEGEVHGQLVWPPRGELGFGYDPIFEPEGYDQTFGEINPELKHKISHRAAAFGLLTDAHFG